MRVEQLKRGSEMACVLAAGVKARVEKRTELGAKVENLVGYKQWFFAGFQW